MRADVMTLDDFIIDESGRMSASRLRELAAFGDRLRAKLAEDKADSRLRELGQALIGVLESAEVSAARDPLPPHLAEAGVAAAYLLKGADLIPDYMPDIGLADDSILVAKIFERNPRLKPNAASKTSK